MEQQGGLRLQLFPNVKAICSVTHTSAVVSAYQAAIAQQQNIAA